ncbi:aldehyde dehydrogenase family protein [Pseudomonas oryzihabitans]|uniref:aldehyde dehydrogenase family protein n=1 Tax=Pseudomonas oryzihabitans TaxID=47885 RepID=UPI0028957650|nr:aldehyde dehydrogenase family protein [Pseudomonas oryzihabitans]MDT3722293.1 aldehyde dehydrogenase family protein [Pseudomonas oryzihabitans]
MLLDPSLHPLIDSRVTLCCYLAGRWVPVPGAARATVTDPATERPLAEVALGGAAEVDQAVRAARSAFDAWSGRPPIARAQLLERLQTLLAQRAEIFAQVMSREMGAPLAAARALQVPLALEHLRVAREVVSDYAFERAEGALRIRREAIGVCALITPWNWPLYQITAKVAPALAAGCTVVLKPSELAPLSALLFAQAVHDAGIPAGVFNLINGDGPTVGAALAEHPDVDMISITGSNRAGVQVAQAAAGTVKRVTQELGGKSPNLLLPDADLPEAVAKGVLAAFRNSGQSCSAPTRMLVPQAQLAEAERLAVATVAGLVVGDPQAPATTHGPLAEGARLVCGGPGRPDGCTTGFYARPTVFSAVTSGMRIAQEEIFGPVICLIPYDSVEEAIAIANDSRYGLSAHVQGRDPDQVAAVAARLRAGQVHLNYPAWNPWAPFGGYKRSGNGREYGVHGVEEYLETKAILGH